MLPVHPISPSRLECCVIFLPSFSPRALLGADIQTMLQFMWHLDIVGVAHFVLDCFESKTFDYICMHGDGTTGTSTSNQLCAAG
jgi:hypothetical protein